MSLENPGKLGEFFSLVPCGHPVQVCVFNSRRCRWTWVSKQNLCKFK